MDDMNILFFTYCSVGMVLALGLVFTLLIALIRGFIDDSKHHSDKEKTTKRETNHKNELD